MLEGANPNRIGDLSHAVGAVKSLTGSPQHIWTDNQDSSSHTIAIGALIYTLIIDALGGRDLATYDLPYYFLQTDMEGKILLCIYGVLALLLVKVNSKRWKKHLRY